MARVVLGAVLLLAGGCTGPHGLGWGDAGAVHKAAWRGNVAAIQRADVTPAELGRVATIPDFPFADRKTPLELAMDRTGRLADRRPERVVRALVEKGLDLNAAGQWRTPLECAALRNGLMAELLIELGADPKLTNKDGMPPIHSFLIAPWTVDVLAGAGADVNARYLGQTALHHVYWDAVAEALLRAGAEVDARDTEGRTPLMTANAGVGPVLASAGAAINARDSHSRTPLMHQAVYADDKQLTFLLEHGAELGARDDRGWTPLHHAAGNPLGTLLFIQRGADVDGVSSEGQTPLMLAAGKGQRRVVELLLESGADPFRKDSAGHTALDLVRAWKPDDAEQIRDGSQPDLVFAWEPDHKEQVRNRLDTIALLERVMARRKDGDR